MEGASPKLSQNGGRNSGQTELHPSPALPLRPQSHHTQLNTKGQTADDSTSK